MYASAATSASFQVVTGARPGERSLSGGGGYGRARSCGAPVRCRGAALLRHHRVHSAGRVRLPRAAWSAVTGDGGAALVDEVGFVEPVACEAVALPGAVVADPDGARLFRRCAAGGARVRADLN